MWIQDVIYAYEGTTEKRGGYFQCVVLCESLRIRRLMVLNKKFRKK